jgi:hypothetical protein
MQNKGKIKYIITKEGITFTLGSKIKTIHKDNPLYEGLIALIKAKNLNPLNSLVFPVKEVAKKYSEHIKEKDGKFYLKGQNKPVPRALGIKIMEFSKEDEKLQPLINFWNNLKLNPSKVSIEELYTFLEKNHHPITEDGRFLAYKKVQVLRNRNDKQSFMSQSEVDDLIKTGKIHDYKWVDGYTGTLDNSKGKIVKMERKKVDPNRTVDCSNGLHVASFSYSFSYPGTLHIEVLVHPKDVVSVPEYEGHTKMRVCQYQSLGIYKDSKQISSSVVRRSTPVTTKYKTKNELSEMKAKEIAQYALSIGMKLKVSPSLLKSKSSLISRVEKYIKSV